MQNKVLIIIYFLNESVGCSGRWVFLFCMPLLAVASIVRLRGGYACVPGRVEF